MTMNEYTIKSLPKYCLYPIFISSRFTYDIASRNANYNKRQKYEKLMNVVLTDKRTDCQISDKYCDLWNQYKKKQQYKRKYIDEKTYVIKEFDNKGILIKEIEINAISHLEALKKLYPNKNFELFTQSDKKNHFINRGNNYNFEVSNFKNFHNSSQNRTRFL